MSERTAVAFSLSSDNAHDAPEGQKLLATFNGKGTPLLMDSAYEGDKTRFCSKQGFVVVVPPKKNRKHPWSMIRSFVMKLNVFSYTSNVFEKYSHDMTNLI